MIFVTYNAETGELISLTDTPPAADPQTCTRVLTAKSADLATWDVQQRAFREELGEQSSTWLTKLAFRNRFSTTEKVAIEIAALDVPTAPMQQRAMAAALRSSLQDTQASTYIDTSRPDTRVGVQQLEAVGILAAGRALAILDAPIQPHEVYVEPK
jgi:hypothetical protein